MAESCQRWHDGRADRTYVYLERFIVLTFIALSSLVP